MATTIIDTIPDGIAAGFLRETESSTLPAIRREGDVVIFPALVRFDGTTYHYFEVPCTFTGQDIEDYTKFALQSYAEIRRFFYGPVTAQLEQQLKGTFAQHQYAVRLAFPKAAGDVPAAVTRFSDIKADFWSVIDAVLTALGKTRDDLPAQPFNSETMLAWAKDNGLSAASIEEAASEIMRISLDLLHNGRNWSELFEEA